MINPPTWKNETKNKYCPNHTCSAITIFYTHPTSGTAFAILKWKKFNIRQHSLIVVLLFSREHSYIRAREPSSQRAYNTTYRDLRVRHYSTFQCFSIRLYPFSCSYSFLFSCRKYPYFQYCCHTYIHIPCTVVGWAAAAIGTVRFGVWRWKRARAVSIGMVIGEVFYLLWHLIFHWMPLHTNAISWMWMAFDLFWSK